MADLLENIPRAQALVIGRAAGFDTRDQRALDVVVEAELLARWSPRSNRTVRR
jgi:hypothetical protein